MEPRRICTRSCTRSRLEEFCPINEQPTEVLLIIFNHLSLDENLYLLPRVCQRWHDIQTDRPLYRDVCFSKKTPSTEDCIYFLRQATSLHSLKLVDRRDTDVILEAVSQFNPTLRCLSVIFYKVLKQSRFIAAPHLNAILITCSGLRELIIEGTRINGTLFCAKMRTRLPDLTTIRLPSDISRDCISSIARNCTRLESFRLDPSFWCPPSCFDEEVTELCDRRQGTLKYLHINSTLLTDTMMKSISKCSLLTHLHLQSLFSVTGRGLKHLGKLKNLQSLHISFCPVPPAAWIALFTCKNMHTLKELSIDCCDGFDDNVVRAIKKFLKCLKFVSVKYSFDVTHEGLEILEDINANE